jgi:hypothetical protein
MSYYYFANLPVEIFHHIFSFFNYGEISNCYNVNRSWRELSSEHLLKLRLSSVSLNDATLNKIISSFPHPIIQFTIEFYSSKLTEECIISVIKKNPQIRSFRVNSPNITDKTLLEISKNCKGLKYLDLSNNSQITEIGILEIANSCSQLEHLNLTQLRLSEATRQKFPSIILALAKNVKYLKYLDIYGLIPAVEHNAPLINLPLSKLSNLEYLNMGNVQCDYFSEIARNCKHLRHLELLYILSLTDNDILAISNNCNKLQVLRVNTKAISDSIATLVSMCPDIRILEISGISITDVTIYTIIEKCKKNLQFIDITYCKDLTDNAKLDLVKAFGNRLRYSKNILLSTSSELRAKIATIEILK